jgi:hypothetical protein
MRDLLQRFKKRKILNLTVASLFIALQLPLGLINSGVAHAAPDNIDQTPTADLHCPDKDNANKVESASGTKTINGVTATWSGDPGQLTFTNTNTTSATVTWCAKGGEGFWNGTFNTGEQTTTVTPDTPVTINFDQAVSYFIMYMVDVETPETPTPASPTAIATLDTCEVGSGDTDEVTVTVTNTNDETDEAVTYTVTLGGQTKTITNLADGASDSVTFNGLTPGSYTASVSGDDGTTATSNTVTVETCAEEQEPANPTAVASLDKCEVGSGNTDEVTVMVTNTDDETDEAVTYTITLGGQTKTITNLADGSNASVTFSGLTAGSYSASVSGDDGTTVTSNTVTVETCAEEEGAQVTLCHATGSESHPFEKITVSAAGAFNGHLGNDHQLGEDIIPPFEFNGATHSQNWDTEGMAIFRNNCVKEVNEQPVEDKVTLCHATGSATNPFVRITVSVSGAFNGHLGASHQNGEDIIPPFEFNGQTYSQNWNAAGQATFNNNCVPLTGGQGGGGQVLGASTTSTKGALGASTLANTGESTMSGLFVALAILGLTGISAYSTRRRYNL